MITAASVAQARFGRGLGVPSFAIGMAAAILIWSGAVAIFLSAFREFRRHGTTVEPGRRPTALLTSGIFRFTRNPLYVSMLLFVTGLAVAMNSLWLAVGVPVLWLLLDRVVVAAEERLIEEAFGSEYVAYKRRTRRWL